MEIDQSTGGPVHQGQSPRFVYWLSFFAFSTITMGSAVSVKKSENAVSSNANWAIFCSGFSFATTGVVTLMHLSPRFSFYVVGTKIEGILTLVLAAFWSGMVSVVANATSGLAIDTGDEDNTIVNGNLYYFSWAGFVTSILLGIMYLRGVFGVDLYGEVRNRSARLTLWAGLLACELVVMGASANILDKDCTGNNVYDPVSGYCRRTKFGVAIGVIGTCFSLGVVSMKMLTAISPLVWEGVLSLLLCILNGFGVAFLTSAEGPGSTIGNLYYFSWLSWLCSFMLIANVHEDFNAEAASSTVEENKVDADFPVETIGMEENL